MKQLMRVANERLNDLMMTKHSNTFQKRNLHKQKIMLTVLWSAVAIIQYSFLESAEVYSQQLNKMHIQLDKMRPAKVNRRGPILLQDNGRPHVARRTQKKLTELE